MHYRLAVCPACTTQDFTAVAGEEEVRDQLLDLWQFQLRRLKPATPLAALYDRAIFSQQPPFHIACCRHCGTVLRTPQEESIVELYSSERPPLRTFADLFEQQLPFFRQRERKLAQLIGRRGSVLEVGSYIGAFLVAAREAGWSAHGVDVNPQANEFARSHDCHVMEAELEDLPATRQYDVVAFWNCFEQLPQPAHSLRFAARLLAPGGAIVLRVPNGRFFMRLLHARPLNMRTAVLAYNNLLGFPYRHAFTPEALLQLAEAARLEVRQLRGDTLAPNTNSGAPFWVRCESAMVQGAVRLLARGRAAPWLELYMMSNERN